MFSRTEATIFNEAKDIRASRCRILQQLATCAVFSLVFFPVQPLLGAEDHTIYQSENFTLNGAVASLCFQKSKVRTEVTIAVIAPRKANGRIDDAFYLKYSDIKLDLYKKSGAPVHCRKTFKNDELFIPILTGIGGLNGDYFCEKLDLRQLSYATLTFGGNERRISLVKLKGS